VLETNLRPVCFPLTLGQRCADWFVLRQFRATSTTASDVLKRDEAIRERMNFDDRPHLEPKDAQAHLYCLATSWFSKKQSTEAMMRGTKNEEAARKAVETMSFIDGVFHCGMVALTETPSIACSPDAVCIINIEKA
jgi:hypothetical protein